VRNVNTRNTFARVRGFFRMMTSSKGLTVGFIIVAFFLITSLAVFVTGLFGARITPYSPTKQFVGPALSGPSFSHLFGTDPLGRDLFSGIIYAMPTDIGVSIAVVSVAFIVGGLIGAFAAFKGGIFDEVLMRATDLFFALPALVLALVIAVILGPGILNMTFVLIIIWWPTYARLARGETLKVAHQNYIEAARLSGFGTFRVLFRHVLPNIFFILLVYATLDVGTVVLVFAGLSYLGLAVTPPNVDWGQMVNLYQDQLLSASWLPLFPGIIIALGVIGFSLFGDGLRDALELR
jgi:ABC-type dipeptide/oligopeptide/nickel transport system permease subunit